MSDYDPDNQRMAAMFAIGWLVTAIEGDHPGFVAQVADAIDRAAEQYDDRADYRADAATILRSMLPTS